MEELMKDLGVTSYQELLDYVEKNPEEQISKEIKELLDEMKTNELLNK